jgi:DNA-binding protein HU-beta
VEGFLTREELTRDIAARTGLSRREAGAALEAALAIIEEALCRGDSVFLRGFGCFEPRPGLRRRARDPRGGGTMEIPSRTRPFFRPYDRLKEAVGRAMTEYIPSAFFHPGGPGIAKVSICGSFNDWNRDSDPMQRLPDGSWVAEIPLPAGRTFSYMFSVDGRLVPDPDPDVPRDDSGRSLRSL